MTLPHGVAAHPAPPTVARVRLRFAKRGRLRFLSHRDVARAFERAVRRAEIPVAYSHGFSPHPRLSWVGAAPTGAASEAEYVEIGLTREVPAEALVRDLDAALPAGLDVLDAVAVVPGSGSLADRMQASRWRIELAGVDHATLAAAAAALLAAETAVVQRMVKDRPRLVDVGAALVDLQLTGESPECAILEAVVRQAIPAVRPDDVLGALRVVADLEPPVPARATRMAQGPLDDRGCLVDPLEFDRAASAGRPPVLGDGHGVAVDADQAPVHAAGVSVGGSPKITPRPERGDTS